MGNVRIRQPDPRDECQEARVGMPLDHSSSSFFGIDLRKLEKNSVFTWCLSPTVFISFTHVAFEGLILYDVNVYTRDNPSMDHGLVINIIPSSSNSSTNSSDDSSVTVALAFMQHLMTTLPLDFFAKIHFSIIDDAPMLSKQQFSMLLSCIPPDALPPSRLSPLPYNTTH
jgi:hypothetical protein